MKKVKSNAAKQVEIAKKTERKPPMPRPVVINHKKIYDRKAMKRFAYEY